MLYNMMMMIIIIIMAVQPYVGRWPLFSFLILYAVGRTPWTGISPPQGRYLHTGQHKHRINTHTDIHASSVIRAHDLSVFERAKAVPARDSSATVIGCSGSEKVKVKLFPLRSRGGL
jgi:hypothetical protein